MKKKIIIIGLLTMTLIISPLLVSCAKPLRVNFLEPKTGTEVNSIVTIKGYISDPKASVWVNDVQVVVTKTARTGRFESSIDFTGFNEGEYTITLMAARGKPGKWKAVTTGTPTKIIYKPE